MLEVKNLVKKYGNKQVLNGISFTIEKGCIYGFLGRNGAGKTTTMNILSGIINYNSGEILFAGKNFADSKREILENIGYVPQNPIFYDYMNAVEYLTFVAELTKYDKSNLKYRIDEVLEFVGLEKEKKKRIKAYSGGMRQRFAIATAVFNKPSLLILDEPTSSLDPEGRIDVLNYVRNLKSTDTTVFLSTHILNDIERVSDEVSIIDKGRLIVSDNLLALKNKYLMPIIDIESSADFGSIIEDLKSIAEVKDIKESGHTLSIYSDDIEPASQKILATVSEKQFPIISFNRRKSNLDDIFMRLINENV